MKASEMLRIGDIIRKLRQERNWTQKQLGERCGINEVQVRRYENNKAIPRDEQLMKIADAFGISNIGELLGLEDVDPHFSGHESKEAEEKFAANIEKHHSPKAKLDVAFGVLNEIGQNKAVEYVEDLTKITEYRKK